MIDSLAVGGAEQSLIALAPHLTARGIDLDVAYLRGHEGLEHELEQSGATVFSLAGPGGRAGWVRRARALVTCRGSGLIHTTLFDANLVGRATGKLTGVPVVTSLVNLIYGPEQLSDPRYKPWKIRALRSVDALTARSVTRWHAIAPYVADVMSVRLRIPRAAIDVVPRGRDPQRLGMRTEERTALARKRLGVEPEDNLVLAASRHEHQKGLDQLLEAFSLVARKKEKVRLVLAGRPGSQTPRLEEIASRLGAGVRIDFVGLRSDLPDLLCGADAFVLPSRWEGFGGVVLEAMALEAPIVASRLPVLDGTLEDGVTARLVPPGDTPALAAAIQDTLDDRATSRRMAGRARAHFLERFTVDRTADRMIEFYRRALAL